MSASSVLSIPPPPASSPSQMEEGGTSNILRDRISQSAAEDVMMQNTSNELYSGMQFEDKKDMFASNRGSVRKLTFTKKDVSNRKSDRQRKLLEIDIRTTIEHFKRLQAENPSFFYAIQIDDENSARNIFWVDGRSRMSFQYFGDVVTFDTTYMTNKHNMPFALFIGVNHHRQSILFGCALIRDESAESFSWVFKTWIEAMNGKHPKSIITDQDPAMKKAIANVLPNTVHRLCYWHIMKNARDHLGVLYGTISGFKDDLHASIDDSLTVEEFEDKWDSMLTKYNLQENSYLQSMYKNREHWAPVFFKDYFFAFISSSQRSKSMNALFKELVNCHASAYAFVLQYEKVIESWCDAEDEEDFRTMQVQHTCWSCYPLERNARDLYTSDLFSIFREQLELTTLYAMREIEPKHLYTMTAYEDPKFPGRRKHSYAVVANLSSESFSCTCKMFNYSGILCAHVLKVMTHLNLPKIPSHYILKRWTRSAKEDVHNSDVDANTTIASSLSKKMRFNNLCWRMVKLASEGSTCTETYKLAMGGINTIISELVSYKQNITRTSNQSEPSHLQLPSPLSSRVAMNRDEYDCNDPPKSQCKGRRKVQRYKSSVELVKAKKQRTCKGCNQKGHNIRTCKLNIAQSSIGTAEGSSGAEEYEDL